MKQSHTFGWDQEPVDERPSEFMHSTGYSVLSGYHPMNDPARPQRPSGRIGFKSMLLFCVVVLVLGGFAVTRFAVLLRG